MTIFTERPTGRVFLLPPISKPAGVPAPGASPEGADVTDVVAGELITADWGTSVAEDLAELWGAIDDSGIPATRSIATTAPLTGGGDLSADRTLAVSDFTTGARGTVPASGGGTTNFLRADGTWSAPPGGGGSGVTDGDKGDIVVSASGATWMFDTAVVTAAAKSVLDDATTAAMLTTLGAQPLDTDLTTIAALAPGNDTVVQRKAGAWVASTPATVKTDLALVKGDVGLGNVDNTADASKPLFSTSTATRGTVVGSNGVATTNFLRADGTWAVPPGGGGGIAGVVIQEDDVTVSTSAQTIDFGNGLDVTETPVGEANVIVDLGEYTGTNLPNAKVAGLGSLALKSTIASADITDGTVALADLANLAQDQVIGRVTASTGVPETFTVTAAARGVLDDTTTAAMLTSLGAQPVDTDLTTIAGLTATTNNVMQSVGSAWASRTPTQLTATLDLATAALKGLLPAWPNNTTTFLRGDGTYASPPVTGSGLLFQYQFNTTLTPPPISGGLRFNNATSAATTAIYVNYTTSDSIDVKTRLLLRIAGDKFYVQDKDNSSVYAQFRLTAAPTDNTTYATLTVVFESGAGTMPAGAILAGFTGAAIPNGDKGDVTVTADGATWTIDAAAVTLAKMANLAQDQVIGRVTASTGPPETFTVTPAARTVLDDTTTAAMLATLGAAGVTDTQTLTNKTLTAPVITVAINAQTGTTYTLVLADASKLVTLTNAAAVTLTVPANSTVAYPVGTTIDLAGLGAGLVTVTQAGGVTVNATPSKVFRAQYSAATLIKLATDSWLLVGDLA